MSKTIIEIPDCLLNDFIEATNRIQDKYYSKQVVEKNPEIKEKVIEAFMEAANILEQLENGT